MKCLINGSNTSTKGIDNAGKDDVRFNAGGV